MSDRKLTYRFGPGTADGKAEQKELLGGKGANLAEMANLGIPVPPGFTITTEMCVEYFHAGGMPSGLIPAVAESMSWLEKQTGKRFGDVKNPLLVSVRSGARSSMPGMMDTILNLGLNDDALEGLASRTGNRRFALDAYRRLLNMYGNVVLGVDGSAFEHALTEARRAVAKRRGIDVPADVEALGRLVPDSALGEAELESVVKAYKRLLAERGAGFPQEPQKQLEGAIEAVFQSWNNDRAKLYRKMHGIPHSWGTAVNVQSMVFGNLGETSATGVAFTRDPSTGEKCFFGEWLPNAQGEDVVAGIRTPKPLAKDPNQQGESLEEEMPENYQQLFEIQKKLETHFRDMQDIEFTIEDQQLFLLQTRNGKRSAQAEVHIAVDMVHEGLLTKDEALMRVDPHRVEQLLFPSVDPNAKVKPIAQGLPASPGAVQGRAVFSADEAHERAEQGEQVILVRTETSPEDLHGMKAARGILTARGGATSHAAVVARGMGRACVVGCSSISIDYDKQLFSARGADGSDVQVRIGDVITLDGSTGKVYVGEVPTVEASLEGSLEELIGWADAVRRLQVRANADTPEQAEKAKSLGAQGIGLCRTEHMFFDEERIMAVREMILAQDSGAREKALAKLLPFQTKDFVELFRVMDGLPVNVRLLDPPLHEFLPTDQDQIAALAKETGVKPADVHRKISELHEYNPMLGHRGCRLAITYPEIYAMQVRAILEAACQVKQEGLDPLPEIMIPLAMSREELSEMKELVERIAKETFESRKCEVAYEFGTMIELPRAAVCADQLAAEAEFFSFGTNDLTQTTLGLSRDDAGRFLPSYVEHGIFPVDPFVSMDVGGVGQLVKLAVERGRATRPDIGLGICGEHGGDPRSVEFFHSAGLGYVSCSPFRVPIAQIAAAQAVLRHRQSG